VQDVYSSAECLPYGVKAPSTADVVLQEMTDPPSGIGKEGIFWFTAYIDSKSDATDRKLVSLWKSDELAINLYPGNLELN